MKKREMIGIIFLVVSIFLLLLSLSVKISLTESKENESENYKNTLTSKGITFLNIKEITKENETG